MKRRTDAIRLELGGVFADEKNCYFSCGRDWWSLAYLPKYPESTTADVMIHGDPMHHNFVIMGNMGAPIPTKIKFCTFSDLCDYLNK